MLTLNVCPCDEGFSPFRRNDSSPACGKYKGLVANVTCRVPGSIIFAEFIATFAAVKTLQMDSDNNANDVFFG
jgi:hypothetical protein